MLQDCRDEVRRMQRIVTEVANMADAAEAELAQAEGCVEVALEAVERHIQQQVRMNTSRMDGGCIFVALTAGWLWLRRRMRRMRRRMRRMKIYYIKQKKK